MVLRSKVLNFKLRLIQAVLKSFPGTECYEVNELLEFRADELEQDFVSTCNPYLERELSGSGFIGLNLLEINSTEEMNKMERAINSGIKYLLGIRHLESSLRLLTDK